MGAPSIEPAGIALSRLEEERFGVVAARCVRATAENFPALLSWCRERSVQLLVVRCGAADFAAIHAIEESGGRLMDGLVYYARDLRQAIPAVDERRATIREGGRADAAAVRRVAERCFRGYGGHYHADPRLDRAKCDETYADWALRSCLSREVAEAVLVAESGGEVVGFLTLRRNREEEAEIVLNGVLPSHQRFGVYRSLLARSLAWARERGAARVVISTQLTNVAVQKAWVRAGFEPSVSYYTFHVWFQGAECSPPTSR